jgi:hypothetical protein
MGQISGNAVLKVQGELKFQGPIDEALDKYKELKDAKFCATLLTEGKTYFGSAIDELLSQREFLARINSTVELKRMGH